jgi:hypothetical protein
MDEVTAFERRLAKGFQGLMGPSEPVDDAAILAVITSTQSPNPSVRTTFGAVKLVIAAAIVILVGGLVLDGVLLTQTDDQPLPMGTSPSSGQGPLLQWTRVVPDQGVLKLPDSPRNISATRVAWVGHRFVLADEDAGVTSTSTDGTSWARDPLATDQDYHEALLMGSHASWRDSLVGWKYESDGMQIARPPDQPVAKYDFGGWVGSVGIGPAGIVAVVQSDSGDGDLHSSGWHSSDGDRWTRIPEFPANMQDVVGVADGFIALGELAPCDGCPSDAGIWHSPDGLTWRLVGPTIWEGKIAPWDGGALLTDGEGRFDLWTSEGLWKLPMAAEIPAWPSDQGRPIGAGPFGIVSIAVESGEVLYSADGTVWSVGPIPSDMAEDISFCCRSPTVAVGERSVVVLGWSSSEPPMPSLWVGTLAESSSTGGG